MRQKKFSLKIAVTKKIATFLKNENKKQLQGYANAVLWKYRIQVQLTYVAILRTAALHESEWKERCELFEQYEHEQRVLYAIISEQF
jgi:hypothetical protein